MRPTRLIPGILLAALYCIPSFASATPLTTMTCNDAESPHGNGISANVHCLAESDIIDINRRIGGAHDQQHLRHLL